MSGEELVDQVWKCVEALERLEALKKELVRDYPGEGIPEPLRGLQDSLKEGMGRLNGLIEASHQCKGTPVAKVRLTGDDLFPDAIRHAYTALYSHCYGSSGTTIGKAHAISIVPKQWFTKSDQQPTRGVAKGVSKKYSSSVTSVVKNERALDLKRRVDKRLRKLAKDIYAEWEGHEPEKSFSCWSCHKIVQREWRWCPRCGVSMERK